MADSLWQRLHSESCSHPGAQGERGPARRQWTCRTCFEAAVRLEKQRLVTNLIGETIEAGLHGASITRLEELVAAIREDKP